MPSSKRIHFYRFLERVLLLLFVIWNVGASVLFSNGLIVTNELIAAAGLSSLLFIGVFFIQRTVDSWLMVSLSHSNYAENEVFASLYDRSPVAYLTLDKKGSINKANQSAVKLLGANSNTLGGANFYNLIGPNEDSDTEVLKTKIGAGMTINDAEMDLSTFDGRLIWTIMSVFPYKNGGERLVSLVDVTDQKNVDTAKSEFVALATHQLRTPIAAIRWNTELLERSLSDVKTESQTKYLFKINRNILRMINLINDFLSVSKLEMGTYAASIEDVNLTDFFSAIIEEQSEKISDKGLSINRQDNPPQVVIKTDSRLLHIVTSNLVSNAVKYIKQNGNLTISYDLDEDLLRLVVADDGIGIPSGEIEKLFTKFYRASNAQSHNTEGTGLGLYIVKQSVEQLGGNIEVESDKNEGARFIITLPADVVTTGS
jgi:two-component system sensor histidine kinase VicK